MRTITFSFRVRACIALFAALLPLGAAHAFSDDEARRAILDLRQRVESQRQVTENTLQQQANSILTLSSQIQELRTEVAVLRGRVEELERITGNLSSQSQPREVTVDGQTFTAQPQEINDYEAGLESLRTGDYAASVTLFQSFLARWPRSGYIDSASFWLGNAQYGARQYQDAVRTFTNLVDRSPDHMRAPDALLSIANCQVELKNNRQVRAVLERLVQRYPQSSAAQEARSRLAQLR